MVEGLSVEALYQSCLATPSLCLFDQGPFLAAKQVRQFLRACWHVLFPGFLGNKPLTKHRLAPYLSHYQSRAQQLLLILLAQAENHLLEQPLAADSQLQAKIRAKAQQFWQLIPQVRQAVAADLAAAMAGDPAVRDRKEIILAYPGFFALTIYRLAHQLHLQQVPLLPRQIAALAHRRTGADIHPGATIGPGCFIDHATGVVIGETAVLGQGIKLYQGVTLGALSFPKDNQGNWLQREKRHPTLEDNVTIYANATVLGGKTVIGAGSILGASVFVTESVPPGSKVLRALAGDPWRSSIR